MDYTYDDSREEGGVTVGKEKEKKKMYKFKHAQLSFVSL